MRRALFLVLLPVLLLGVVPTASTTPPSDPHGVVWRGMLGNLEHHRGLRDRLDGFVNIDSILAPATSLPQAPSRGKANTCQTASSYSVEEDVPVIVAPLWDYPWQTGGTRVKTTTVKLHGAGLSDGSGQPWNLDSGFIAQWNQDGDLTKVDEKVHLTPR